MGRWYLALNECCHGWAHDYDVVLAAVQKYGHALKYASMELRANRTIVLAAVSHEVRGYDDHHRIRDLSDLDVVPYVYKSVLYLASDELRADRDLVLTAVAHDALALYEAAPELRADREIVLTAIAQNAAIVLRGEDRPELRADTEIMLTAVRQDGRTICLAAPALVDDPDFLARAVRANGAVYDACFASHRESDRMSLARHLHDRRVLLAAIRHDINVLKWAPRHIPLTHGEFVLEAARENGELLRYFHCLNDEHPVKANRDVVLAALGRGPPDMIRYVSLALKTNAEVVACANAQGCPLHLWGCGGGERSIAS